MTKKELLDAIHGQMIISCQAVKGEPLYVEEKSIMYLMARAHLQSVPAASVMSSRSKKKQDFLSLVWLRFSILDMKDISHLP